MKMNANGWLSELVKITSNCLCSLLCELSIQKFFCSYSGVISSVLHTLAIVQQLQMLKSAMFYFWGKGKTLTVNVALKVS